MPHNLLITAPGAVAEVGRLAEQLGAKGPARDWRPDTPKVLHATPMLQRGESATLDFVAPDVPGDYGFVCTFPGHWRLMQGVMRVVAAPERR